MDHLLLSELLFACRQYGHYLLEQDLTRCSEDQDGSITGDLDAFNIKDVVLAREVVLHARCTNNISVIGLVGRLRGLAHADSGACI